MSTDPEKTERPQASSGKHSVGSSEGIEVGHVRVMQVVTRLGVSGATRHVITLAEGLKEAGYQCRLIAGSEGEREGSMKDVVDEEQLHVLPELQRAVDVRRDLTALFKLYRLMRRERPHVVHTQTAKAGFIGRVAARLAGVPVVFHTINGHFFHGYFSKAKTRFFKVLERIGSGLSDRVLTVSERLRQDIVEHGVAKSQHVAIIPQGVHHLDRLTASAKEQRGTFRSALGLDKEAMLYAAVGRLAPVKNLRLFLEAAARIAQVEPRAHFALVGDGAQRRELERFAEEQGLEGRVTFTGWREEVASVYVDAEAVVISSRNEGTPTSLIEAMAFECPIVSTRVGGVPDMVAHEKTGRLVPPSDPEALSEAMLAVVRENGKTRRMAKEAKTFVFEHFDARHLIERVDGIYRRFLQEKGIL